MYIDIIILMYIIPFAFIKLTMNEPYESILIQILIHLD